MEEKDRMDHASTESDKAVDDEVYDPQFEREVLQISEEVRSGKQRTYPLSEVMEEYGL